MKCECCNQEDIGQTGEYPCEKCGLPTIWDLDYELIEEIANIEHEQWIAWSKNIAATETITKERLERWKSCWVPYSDLSNEMKNQDRLWAMKVMEIIDPNLRMVVEEQNAKKT